MRRPRRAAADQSSGFSPEEQILAGLDSTALEFDAPPPDVWLGIAASLAAESEAPSASPRVAPDRLADPPAAVEYEINADDVIVAVGWGWHDAADYYGSPELHDVVGGTPLWDGMGDNETRELWQLVVHHVRSTGEELVVPIRCDGPAARQWFDLTVSARPAGNVHFHCAIVFAEDRDSASPLLDAAIQRDPEAEPVRICGWCGRGSVGDGWLELDDLLRSSRVLESEVVPPVSYGVCSDCRDDLATTLQAQTGGAAVSR